MPNGYWIDKLGLMVRPFDLRDLALIRRLGERGIPLHTVSALAENFHPLRGAIMNMLIGGEFPTFVWKKNAGEKAGFIQLRLGHGKQAYLLHISPRCDSVPESGSMESGSITVNQDCAIWLDLLDEAVAYVGQYGIHHIIAEVDELSPELLILRRAGFAVYTRQDIWAIKPSSFQSRNLPALELVRRHMSDDWDIQLLYANTVPRLVQLVEPMPPIDEGENWVIRDRGNIAAAVHFHKGAVATWLRFFIHPDAEAEAEAIVIAALRVAFATEPEIVYCCVRRYESWLPSALDQCGFSIFGSQAVMVRHTVHPLPRMMADKAIALEGKGISAPSTFVRGSEPFVMKEEDEAFTGINGSKTVTRRLTHTS
ncbi:MAG: hypothetical protein R6X18_06690 [Chloroflexota bacterium]